MRGVFACAAVFLHVVSDAGMAVCVDASLQEFVSEAALHKYSSCSLSRMDAAVYGTTMKICTAQNRPVISWVAFSRFFLGTTT